MAGKTSSSVGVGVAITLLSVCTLALFVAFAIFFGKYNSQKEEYNRQKAEIGQFIASNEMKDAALLALAADAKKSNQSLVAYLTKQVGSIMKTTTGVENTKFSEYDDKVKAALGGEAGNVLGALAAKNDQIAALTTAAADSDAARKRAEEALAKEADKVKGTQDELKAENDKLNAKIAGYEAELKGYRDGLDGAQEQMTKAIAALQADADAKQKILEAKNAALERENLVIVEQLAKLRGQQGAEVLKAQNEEALVDASIVGVSPDGKQVVINVGSSQKVPLGITFAVYSEAKQIRVDEKTGEYKRGKAVIEVINVGGDTATCRVNAETKGSPVVKGDVVANAVYDPAKTYKFVVFGNFDTNGDGVATPLEKSDMVAMIEGWGGKVASELAGDIDFLVLGEKPILPPRPSDGSPFEVVQQYMTLQQEVGKYDELYKSAQSTSVPILNQNRFMTLIGAKPIRSASR